MKFVRRALLQALTVSTLLGCGGHTPILNWPDDVETLRDEQPTLMAEAADALAAYGEAQTEETRQEWATVYRLWITAAREAEAVEDLEAQVLASSRDYSVSDQAGQAQRQEDLAAHQAEDLARARSVVIAEMERAYAAAEAADRRSRRAARVHLTDGDLLSACNALSERTRLYVAAALALSAPAERGAEVLSTLPRCAAGNFEHVRSARLAFGQALRLLGGTEIVSDAQNPTVLSAYREALEETGVLWTMGPLGAFAWVRNADELSRVLEVQTAFPNCIMMLWTLRRTAPSPALPSGVRVQSGAPPGVPAPTGYEAAQYYLIATALRPHAEPAPPPSDRQ